MFFNKNKGFILSLGLLFSSLSLSSCSAFFGGNEGYLIEDLTTRVDEDGNTIVTITFDNEDVNPVTFTIPKGMSGETGIGIDHITSNLNSEGTILTLTIYYTSDTLEPTIIELPVIKGNDGKGINNVIVGKDEIGNTTIQFEYSDGTSSEIITINKGIDGVGIDHFEQSEDLLNNRIVITIYYTNGDSSEIYVPNGKDGIGIKNITSKDNGSEYLLTITFSDNSTQNISLPKPIATMWYSGNGLPQSSLGNNGDFYLNESSGEVYKKINGTWNLLFSMTGTGTSVSYQVTFKLNGGKRRFVDATDIAGSESKDKVITKEKGEYINLNSPEYEAYYDGYTFNGWWTDEELNANSGHFTNLTPVMGDITLYANWIMNV